MTDDEQPCDCYVCRIIKNDGDPEGIDPSPEPEKP